MDESSTTRSSSAARGLTLEIISNRRTQNKTTDERSSKNTSDVQNHNFSSNETAANTNSCHHKKSCTKSSNPYNGMSVELTSDRAAAAERSMAATFRNSNGVPYDRSSYQTSSANDELKLVENIADHLSPHEVRRLLFLGHEDEHKAYSFLRPCEQLIDLRTSCIYCYQSIVDGNSPFSSRLCGHLFHFNCFELQGYSMKEKHFWNKECIFCSVAKNGR